MKLEEIEPFKPMIEQYAWVAIRKIKKPTIHSHQDLVNEGITLLIEIEKTQYKPERGASLKTYFTLLLRNYFGEIIIKSYSCHSNFPNEERVRNFIKRFRKKSAYQDPSDIASSRMLVEEFTDEEVEYTSAMLLASGKSMNKRRQEARESLNMTFEQETKIRHRILTKIHG